MRLVRWALACTTALLLVSPAAADPAGSATGGNAGSQSWLGGCKYNAVAPTLVSGQQAGLQCDVNGNLAVTGGGGGGGGNVNLTGINSVTPLVGAGATGTGSLRITVAQDATTIAGSAPGTAGTASTNVVTVQGISGGVSQPVADSALLSAVNGATPAGSATIGATGYDPSVVPVTSASINVSTATTTQIVALSSGKRIYVSGGVVMAGGTGNITFEYGTGTACATGTTVLGGAMPLVANVGFIIPDKTYVVPSGNALCVLTSAAVQYSGTVGYVQK